MERSITVRGEGSLSLAPDLISVGLSIIKKDKDYANAMNESAKLLASLRGALKPLGFSDDDLKTVSFSVNTEYESVRENNTYRNVFAGYNCVHSLDLDFPFDTERLSSVLSAIAGCLAEPELSVRFSVRDRDAAVCELLRRAANEARVRAEALAAASGVKLGQLISVVFDRTPLSFESPTRYGMNLRAAKCECVDEMKIAAEDVRLSESAVFVWEIVS